MKSLFAYKFERNHKLLFEGREKLSKFKLSRTGQLSTLNTIY